MGGESEVFEGSVVGPRTERVFAWTDDDYDTFAIVKISTIVKLNSGGRYRLVRFRRIN